MKRLLILFAVLATISCKKEYREVKANASGNLTINGFAVDNRFTGNYETGHTYTIVSEGATTQFLSVWVDGEVVFNSQAPNKITFKLDLK